MLLPYTTHSDLTVLPAGPQMYQGPYYEVLRHALSQLANSNFSFFVLKTQFTYNLLCKDVTELARRNILSSEQPLRPGENLNIADHLLSAPPLRTEILQLSGLTASLMSERFCHSTPRPKGIPNGS